MHRRLNITLPAETVDRIAQVVRKGDRSRFIDRAIKRYLHEMDRKDIREQLKEGYSVCAEQDLESADEWASLEDEAWRKNNP